MLSDIVKVIILLAATVACASSPRDHDRPGGKEPEWLELEQQLREAGVSPDTASLIAVSNSNRDLSLRWAAIEVLGLRKEREARDVLWQLTQDEEPLLRETAALALARIGDERGVSALKDFMQATPTTERRLFLAARLAEFGNPSGYSVVTEATKSEDPHVRFLSVSSLVPFVHLAEKGKKLQSDPLDELMQLARDEARDVRYEVLVQLPIAAPRGAAMRRAKPLVEKMAEQDPDAEVREKAGLVLILWSSGQK